MNDLRQLLEEVAAGRIDPAEAEERARRHQLGFEDMGFARFDTDRARRTGVAEVIFSPGKTDEQLERLIGRSLERHDTALATRLTPERAPRLLERFPRLEYNPTGRIIKASSSQEPWCPAVAVVSAGTSDQPVAEEAAAVLEHLGHPVDRVTDVGVAGIHRLFSVLDRLLAARALVVVAGMEGALPSVVAGLVTQPVVAVPTSVGYGASFGGLAALLAMLNSCAGGIGVVNIDNGFGAAALVHRIAPPEPEQAEVSR